MMLARYPNEEEEDEEKAEAEEEEMKRGMKPLPRHSSRDAFATEMQYSAIGHNQCSL